MWMGVGGWVGKCYTYVLRLQLLLPAVRLLVVEVEGYVQDAHDDDDADAGNDARVQAGLVARGRVLGPGGSLLAMGRVKRSQVRDR